MKHPRAVLIVALACLLVLAVHVQATTTISVFSGGAARRDAAVLLGDVQSAVSSSYLLNAAAPLGDANQLSLASVLLSPEGSDIDGRFNLFRQPASVVALVFHGAASDGAKKSSIVDSSGVALDAGDSLSWLPAQSALPKGDVKLERLAKILALSGLNGVFVSGESIVIDGVTFDSASSFVREAAALATLHKNVQADKRIAHEFKALQDVLENRRSYDVARNVFAKLVKRFVDKVNERVLVVVAETQSLSREVEEYHVDYFASQSFAPRNGTGTCTDDDPCPSYDDIAQYQLGIWSFFIITIILAAFLIGTCNMSVIKDSYSRELYREESGPI